MKKNKYFMIGASLMLLSSCMTCTGQLMWKLASIKGGLAYYLIGFILYGFGAVVMMFALSFGELSILHPMLSFGFVVSIFLGSIVLSEEITTNKIFGIALIIIGLVFMAISAKKEEQGKGDKR